ncbi:hypothetical protein B484DRAFT_449049 [Ochromonadaceae sp. CCMP2298]|nr:hypothetical protein B484DRAFT_449049 [Ochromonadaceae sp. CCMP2298]|mmetsp:Transcript_22711/g.50503  ORF Transcript_22711/g.50503 Transcript_22711/m.50503 type:complete len:321 (+) Transcript_22711:54-1016(+)
MEVREEQYYDEMAICEGGLNPLESNRTAELAMECWNLRKTIMEQSASVIKMKKEMKSQKNLVKNLQKCLLEVESESLAKTKDIHAKKITILQCEKKIHEISSTNSFVQSTVLRNRKVVHVLNGKIDEQTKQNHLLSDKFTTMQSSLKEEMASQESALCLEIRKVGDERDRLARDLAVQKTYQDETGGRIEELDASGRELRAELEAQSDSYSESLALLQSEQERSFDQLHQRLECIWGERDAFLRRLVEKEHENHQLMSFLLMEGLQLPELVQPADSVYEAVSDKYPAGSSTLVEGVQLLSGGMLSGGTHEEEEDDDDYNY